MIISAGPLHYRWTEWATPPTDGLEWAHHGLAVTNDQRVVAWDQAADSLVFVDPETQVIESHTPIDVISAHGLTIAGSGADEVVWVAEPGNRRRLEGGTVRQEDRVPRVMAAGFDGATRLELPMPPSDAYRSGPYRPTGVAVAEERFGGDGSIWVADGYGASLVHRYDAAGNYRATLDGEAAGARFNCPHAVFVDRRGPEPELLVADRGNAVIRAFDLDGSYRRTIGEGRLSSPSAFATAGDVLIVAELRSRLAAFDDTDGLIGYLGDGGDAWQGQGWPNAGDPATGTVQPPTALPEGRFRAPHGLTALADGTILVAEWLIGGRVVQLETVSA
jgi:hypothetical protein